MKKRKPIARRSKFKAHGDNPLKTYRRRFSDYTVMCQAESARQARLRDRTLAELAFEEILVKLGVSYETEKIIQNGDRWVLLDYACGLRAFEIDGSAHRDQPDYDAGRTRWLEGKGYAVHRFTNYEVLQNPEETTQKVQEILQLKNAR